MRESRVYFSSYGTMYVSEAVSFIIGSDFTNLFLKWVYPFGRCLVELSSQYPLISGFYKLLAVCILKADERGYFGKMESSLSMKAIGNTKEIEIPSQGDTIFGYMISQQDHDLCKDLFYKYLQEVLISSRCYKLDLLVSCLRLCLLAPSPIINIASLVGPMICALKIGLRHCPLENVAMDSLETWHRLHPNKIEPWLQQIVPYFNSYLIHFERKFRWGLLNMFEFAFKTFLALLEVIVIFWFQTLIFYKYSVLVAWLGIP
jgi:DNA-dependent protein kinase catalytic subunit